MSQSSPAPIEYGITLEHWVQAQFAEGSTQGYHLYIAAKDATNMSRHIFVYQVGMIDTETGETSDRFVNVASPSDLEEYPAESPGATDRFYRLDKVDLVFRSPLTANETWEAIQNDVASLVRTLKLMSELKLVDEVRIESS